MGGLLILNATISLVREGRAQEALALLRQRQGSLVPAEPASKQPL